MADRIIYASPDIAIPSGGVRVLYRHVELLTKAGYDAVVWHCDQETAPDWFDAWVPVCHGATLDLDDSDILVVPEGFVMGGVDPAPGCRKVIFNQNHFNMFTFAAAEDYPRLEPPPAMWVVSQASGRIMERLSGWLGLAAVEHVPCAIDTDFFRPAPERARKVVWMPRKRPYEAALIHALLSADSRLDGVVLTPIDGFSEAQTAAELADAAVFIALGRDEGFGLPVAEALAAGCAVVGYPSGGGAELFEGPGTFAIHDSDVLAIVDQVVAILDQEPSPTERHGYRAWVERNYSETRLLTQLERAIERSRAQPGAAGKASHLWPDVVRVYGLLAARRT